MHPDSEMVRSVLRVAYKICLIAESFDDPLPGPKLSQIQFGRYMARTDPYTAGTIAADILQNCPPVLQSQLRSTLVDLIRGHWNQCPAEKKYILSARFSLDSAVILTNLVTQQAQKNQELIDLIRIASVLKTWTAVSRHYPKRCIYSIKDDYDKFAKTFYTQNKKIICDFSTNTLKVSKLKKLR